MEKRNKEYYLIGGIEGQINTAILIQSANKYLCFEIQQAIEQMEHGYLEEMEEEKRKTTEKVMKFLVEEVGVNFWNNNDIGEESDYIPKVEFMKIVEVKDIQVEGNKIKEAYRGNKK